MLKFDREYVKSSDPVKNQIIEKADADIRNRFETLLKYFQAEIDEKKYEI